MSGSESRDRAAESALADAHTWLRRADDTATQHARAILSDEHKVAALVQAYATAADVCLREAEFRAALEGKIIPAVETPASRYVAAAEGARRFAAEEDAK